LIGGHGEERDGGGRICTGHSGRDIVADEDLRGHSQFLGICRNMVKVTCILSRCPTKSCAVACGGQRAGVAVG